MIREFKLTMRIDLEAFEQLRKLSGTALESETHARFLEDSTLAILRELRELGVHPEILEDAFRRFKDELLSEERAKAAIYA